MAKVKEKRDLPSTDYEQLFAHICDVPGQCGMSMLGDRSIEFYRHTSSFVNRNIDHCGCRIFQARLLNRPTVFVASNSAVREMLNEKSDCFDMGYKDYFYDVFGDNILFTNEEETKAMKLAMKSLFQKENIDKYNTIIEKISNKFIDNLSKESKPECIYQYFKQMCLNITLSIFLGIEPEKDGDLIKSMIDLTTTHWHGLISLPIRFNFLPKSGFAKALEAKETLLALIMKRLAEEADSGMLNDIKTNRVFKDDKQAAQNILVFISALIPKALASLITSFILTHHLWINHVDDTDVSKLSDSTMECVLLEVMRLYPPFLGGRRVAKRPCKLMGFHIPEGMPVIYINEAAQRDPDVFCNGDEFDAARWKERNAKDRDKLFLFGSGPRQCVGWHLSWNILMYVCKKLYAEFTWESPHHGGGGRGEAATASLHYKWLPVTRPKHVPRVTFTPRSDSGCGTRQ